MGSDVPTILAGFGGIEAYAMEQIPAMNGGMTIAAKVTFCFVADFQDAVKVGVHI